MNHDQYCSEIKDLLIRKIGARETGISGVNDEGIERVSALWGMNLPLAYSALLKVAGRSSDGIFEAEGALIDEIDETWEQAAELCAEANHDLQVVFIRLKPFLCHQGHELYLMDLSVSSEDPPVVRFNEGDGSFSESAERFTVFIAEFAAAVTGRRID